MDNIGINFVYKGQDISTKLQNKKDWLSFTLQGRCNRVICTMQEIMTPNVYYYGELQESSTLNISIEEIMNNSKPISYSDFITFTQHLLYDNFKMSLMRKKLYNGFSQIGLGLSIKYNQDTIDIPLNENLNVFSSIDENEKGIFFSLSCIYEFSDGKYKVKSWFEKTPLQKGDLIKIELKPITNETPYISCSDIRETFELDEIKKRYLYYRTELETKGFTPE